MSKVDLKICCGINCLIRGGQELLDALEDNPELVQMCEFECVKCLEFCDDGKESPVVQIQDKIYTKITLERFLSLLDQEIQNES